MSNDNNLMLLFTAGIFLIALLTFIVLLIEKISKK
ncbi:putative holin-like toxin [Clostridium uliginosum]|nr:putative holin-like toxin [Clostridium uliginosum]